jgi:hypothetical protein
MAHPHVVNGGMTDKWRVPANILNNQGEGLNIPHRKTVLYNAKNHFTRLRIGTGGGCL